MVLLLVLLIMRGLGVMNELLVLLDEHLSGHRSLVRFESGNCKILSTLSFGSQTLARMTVA